MGKNDRIHVFLRVRPNRDRRGPDDEGYQINHTFEKSTIQFHVDKSRRDDDFVNHSVEDYRFEFDRVFGPKTTQEEMFNMVAKDCVLSAMDGYNSTIFAYGQTGSGKTYSITGGTESYQDRGIIPRAVSLVYDECAKRSDFTWNIRISYLQIYNDKGQDLLNRGKDAKTLDELPTVTVHETDEEVILKGLEAHPSNTIHDALNLLFLGDTNRLYCETPMNKTSSRSHCIFTISIEGRQHGGGAIVRRSKLNLVDLAGSERVGKTGVQGNLLTEAKYINLSLHYLEHVIVALSEQSKGTREHIPYRNSFMTMCLRDSLGGNCRTAMLATAHPAPEYFMETISTCKFAQRVACIKQDARVNEETDPSIVVKQLKARVAQLSDQLAFYKKGDQSADRKMDGDEYERCREVVQRFIDDPDPEANISGINGDLPRILACFKIMKGMLGGKVNIVPGMAATAATGNSGGVMPSSTNNAAAVTSSPPPSPAELSRLKSHVDALTISLQQKENEISLLFNLVEKSSAPKFNAETQTGDPNAPSSSYDRVQTSVRREAAPQSENPSSLAGLLQQRQEAEQQQQQSEQQQQQQQPLLSAVELKAQDERMKDNYDLSALADSELLKDRQAAFEAFRRSYRKYEQIDKNKIELKGKYDECKTIAMEVNACVDSIKQLKLRVNQLRADRALQGVNEPHPDEVSAMQQLAEVKQLYQAKGAELGKKKEYIDQMHLIMMRAQEQLAKDFDDWFTSRLKQLQIAQQQQARLNNSSSGGGSGGGGGGNNNAAGSGSRAAMTMVQQMDLNGNMVPTTATRGGGGGGISGGAQQQQQQFASSYSSSRVPPAAGSSSARHPSSASGVLPAGNSSFQQQQQHIAPNMPSSAPPSSSGGYHAAPSSTAYAYGAAAPNTSSSSLSSSLAGMGGAAFRQRSPPPSTSTTTFSSSTSVPTQQQQNGFAYARPLPSNPLMPSPSASLSSPYSMLGGGGSAFSAEQQHREAMAQHQQHAQQMATINRTSTNSLYAGPSGNSGYYTSPTTTTASSAAAANTTTGGGCGMGAANGSSTSSSITGNANSRAGSGMNPYCPQYPSTGDDAADQQLAAMYKARDEMRVRLQQQQGRK